MLALNALISFYGPSGSGKSTCYEYALPVLESLGLEVHRCDVAYPLRRIQNYAYELFGKEKPGNPDDSTKFRQDGVFLSFLAKHFSDRLGPLFLKRAEELLSRNSSSVVALVNTDCRNNAYPVLAEMGFRFVKLEVRADILDARRKERGDITYTDYESEVEKYNLISPSDVIWNNGTKDSLKKMVEDAVLKIAI